MYLCVSVTHRAVEGPESQLRYNLNVCSLEIQDFKQGNDIGYKIKAIINLRSKTRCLQSSIPHTVFDDILRLNYKEIRKCFQRRTLSDPKYG